MHVKNVYPMGSRRGRLAGMRGLGSGDSTESSSSSESGSATRSTTAVSPTIQQQFTPQISPVFQQSSGGGSQSASTQQIAPGGQSGQGGSAADSQPKPAGAAGGAGTSGGYDAVLPSLAPDPFSSNFDALKYGTGSQPIIQQRDNTMMYLIGFAALLGVGFVVWKSQSRKGI